MESIDQNLTKNLSELAKLAEVAPKTELLQLKEELKTFLFNNCQDKLQLKNIFTKIASLISLLNEIFNERIKKTIEQYESLIRRDEQTQRILYKNLLTYKILKDSLDNRIRLLLIKEKEYELIKDKTGAYIQNGEIIYNKQKDNEIIILKQENSNLKNIIDNYEKIITEQNSLYEDLKTKYNNIQNKINKTKAKKITIPNININLSDSHNLTIAERNAIRSSQNLNNLKKLSKNSDKNSFKAEFTF